MELFGVPIPKGISLELETSCIIDKSDSPRFLLERSYEKELVFGVLCFVSMSGEVKLYGSLSAEGIDINIKTISCLLAQLMIAYENLSC